MAEIKIGSIVKSAAGHDKGDFQVVLNFDEKYAFVVDGKHRPLEKPKKKKLIHLKITKMILESENMVSNKAIRQRLRKIIR